LCFKGHDARIQSRVRVTVYIIRQPLLGREEESSNSCT